MKFKKWEIALIAVLAVIMVVAGVMLSKVIHEYFSGSEMYEGLEAYVFLPEETPEETGQSDKESVGDSGEKQDTEESKVYYSDPPKVNFEALRERNADVRGWIYGAGTAINYPVVQGEDNAEYLYTMFDGQENKCGSIFLDSLNESDFSDQNSIIHGHHMKNGTMFAGLVKYAEQSYYDSHPMFWLVTPEKTYRVELFAGFVTDVESDVWQIGFETEDDFENWKSEMARKSLF